MRYASITIPYFTLSEFVPALVFVWTIIAFNRVLSEENAGDEAPR